MELLTKGQLSDHIGVTPRTVESWMRDGLLPYIKIRRSVRFDLTGRHARVKNEARTKYGAARGIPVFELFVSC